MAKARNIALRKVVFDIDDTCWPLGKTAAKRSGIEFSKMQEFQVMKNSALTMEERTRLNEALYDPTIYRELEFYPGFKEILTLRECGADSYFSSNSFSQEINDHKAERLLVALPKFPADHVQLHLIDDESTVRKKIPEDTYILVNDSPYTVARSPARYNIVPMMPWNQTEAAIEMLRDIVYVFVPAGQMEKICAIVRFLLRQPNE